MRFLLRVLLATFAATVAMAILVGVHYYLATRLLLEPAFPEPWRSLGLTVVVLGGLSVVGQPIFERVFPRWVSSFTAWPASLCFS